jgi:hypothetical protein
MVVRDADFVRKSKVFDIFAECQAEFDIPSSEHREGQARGSISGPRTNNLLQENECVTRNRANRWMP